MNRFLEIIIVLAFLSTILVSLKLAYGQGSLDNLENEMDTQRYTQGYRGELEGYITSHNISLAPIDMNGMDTFTLEVLVKAHMRECKSGENVSIGVC